MLHKNNDFRVLHWTKNIEGKGTPRFELGLLSLIFGDWGSFNHLPNYAPAFGSIQECLWITPLADKKINEVNINVMERKRVLRKVQIPSPALF
jgi:hypothetical protein